MFFVVFTCQISDIYDLGKKYDRNCMPIEIVSVFGVNCLFLILLQRREQKSPKENYLELFYSPRTRKAVLMDSRVCRIFKISKFIVHRV